MKPFTSLAWIAFPITTTAVFPDIKNIRRTYELGLHDPRNFGDVHNSVFEKAAEHYRSGGSSSLDDKNDVLEHVKTSLKEFYPDDADYGHMVDEYAVESLENFGKKTIDEMIVYPDDMEEGVRDLFDRTFQAISALDRNNLQETLSEIESLQKEAEDVVRRQHPLERYRTVAALSVARASTELWHGMRYGSEENSRALRELSSLGEDIGEWETQVFDDMYEPRNLQSGQPRNCLFVTIASDVVTFLGIAPIGVVLSWVTIIPALTGIFLPALALTVPLLVIFMVPFIFLFLVFSVIGSAIGWLFGTTFLNCDNSSTTNSTNV